MLLLVYHCWCGSMNGHSISFQFPSPIRFFFVFLPLVLGIQLSVIQFIAPCFFIRLCVPIFIFFLYVFGAIKKKNNIESVAESNQPCTTNARCWSWDSFMNNVSAFMRCMFLLISTRFMAFDNASQTIWLQVGFYRCEHGVCLSMYNFPQSNSLTLVCFSSPAGFRTCRECFWVYPRFFLSSALRYPSFLLLRFLSLSC